jgi:sulfate adenylyltransferase subunit 1 (EFTu-like GTPase family)
MKTREAAGTRTLFDARIAQWAGGRRMVVAIDRMERVGYEYVVFKDVEARILALAQSFEITDVHCIPISTARGDMVVRRGEGIDWYDGPTLIEAIES